MWMNFYQIQKNKDNMDLEKLSKEAFETAKAHGWHEEEQPDEHLWMLIITEIAEAVQADRKGRHANTPRFRTCRGQLTDCPFEKDFEIFIKDSVEDELADIIIRCLDYAALRGIGLDRVPSYATSYCIDKSIAKHNFPTFAYFLTFKTVNGDVTDVLARVIAYCKLKGIDIDFYVEQKMRYNKQRSYKHGNKKY